MSDVTPELLEEQRGAAEKRRAFASSPLGTVSRTLKRVIGEYLDARSKGVSQEIACKGIEEELRAIFPPTKYPRAVVCATCEDTGWEHQACEGDEGAHGPICGRQFLHGAHTFVRFCFCEKGERLRRQGGPKAADEATVDAAAKASHRKRGTWSRMGR